MEWESDNQDELGQGEEYPGGQPLVYLVKVLSAVNSTAGNVVYRGRIMEMSQADTEGLAIAWDDPGTTGPEILFANLTTTRIATDGSKYVIVYQVGDRFSTEYYGT